jgi:DNA-directed RNA polymerase subunit M/transcription elongation factor TFIIS
MKKNIIAKVKSQKMEEEPEELLEDENAEPADDDVEEDENDRSRGASSACAIEEEDEISIPIIQEDEEEEHIEILEEPVEEVPIDEEKEEEEEIIVGHENNPTVSKLMKRKENKYKFSKELANYGSQHERKERVINGFGCNGKYSAKDFQELRTFMKKTYGKEIENSIYKIITKRVQGKAKSLFLIKTYMEILGEEEKRDQEGLRIRFEKEMNEFTEMRDVEEGHHICKNCGCRKTISNFIQIRSSDEAMSEIITCVSCANRWIIH